MALLAQKLWRTFFLSKSVTGYFKAERKEFFFCGFPKSFQKLYILLSYLQTLKSFKSKYKNFLVNIFFLYFLINLSFLCHKEISSFDLLSAKPTPIHHIQSSTIQFELHIHLLPTFSAPMDDSSCVQKLTTERRYLSPRVQCGLRGYQNCSLPG